MKTTMTAIAALMLFAGGALAQSNDTDHNERKAERQQDRKDKAQAAQETPATPAQPAARPLRPAPRPMAPAQPTMRPASSPPAMRQPRPMQPDQSRARPDHARPVTPMDDPDVVRSPQGRPNMGQRPARPEPSDTAGEPRSPRPVSRPSRPARSDMDSSRQRGDRPAGGGFERVRPAAPVDGAGQQGRREPRGQEPRQPRAERVGGGSAVGRDRTGRAVLPTRPGRPGAGRLGGNARDGFNRPARMPRFDVQRSNQIRLQVRSRVLGRGSWSYRIGGRDIRVVRAERYRYPGGYRYRVYRRGERFPAALLVSNYFLSNFYSYGLTAPSPGYRWVRFGPDAVLIDLSSYEVADTRYGVFYEGSPDMGGANLGGYDQRDLPPIDPSLPQAFASGELDMQAYGGNCDDFYGDSQLQADIDDAWSNEDWNGLARLITEAGCQTDLSYYLLGLAAEGLVLPDAAASYYQRALDLYDAQPDDDCDAFGEEACRGLHIDDEAAAGLQRIYGGDTSDGDRRD